MSMFKQEHNRTDEVATIIGPSVQVDGNFVANGDIIVEGSISGSIKTEKNLQVGAQAKIFANISAANAVIAGEIQGSLKIKDNLELTSTAKIFGDVKTQTISIESGAVLHGRCQVGDVKKSKAEKIDDRHAKLKDEKDGPLETPLVS